MTDPTTDDWPDGREDHIRHMATKLERRRILAHITRLRSGCTPNDSRDSTLAELERLIGDARDSEEARAKAAEQARDAIRAMPDEVEGNGERGTG